MIALFRPRALRTLRRGNIDKQRSIRQKCVFPCEKALYIYRKINLKKGKIPSEPFRAFTSLYVLSILYTERR